MARPDAIGDPLPEHLLDRQIDRGHRRAIRLDLDRRMRDLSPDSGAGERGQLLGKRPEFIESASGYWLVHMLLPFSAASGNRLNLSIIGCSSLTLEPDRRAPAGR